MSNNILSLGDNVQLNDSYRIIQYLGTENLLKIQINDHKFTILAHIDQLGIFLPLMDYYYPGEGVPSSHPDYYKRISLTRNAAIFEKKGVEYTIELDASFRFTGMYRLKPVKGEITIIRTAQLRGPTERTQHIRQLMNQDIPGSTLTGKLIFITGNDRECDVGFEGTNVPALIESDFTILHFLNLQVLKIC